MQCLQCCSTALLINVTLQLAAERAMPAAAGGENQVWRQALAGQECLCACRVGDGEQRQVLGEGKG